MATLSKLFILIIFISLAFSGAAQSLRSYERAGDNAFEKKDYGAAIQYYATVLKEKGEKIPVWWKYGECALLFDAYQEAEKAFLRVESEAGQSKKYPLLYERLGDVKRGLGDYENALKYYNLYLDQRSGASEESGEAVRSKIASCNLAQSILTNPATPVDIRHLGKEINSPYSDFAPVVVGDTLFFSSYRFDKKGGHETPKSKITKVMISSKGGRAREPGRGFPTADTAHIAHTAFSPDGHYVFFTICKNLNAHDIRCELWLTVIDKHHRWLPPVRLPEPVNMAGYTTTQPSIGYDDKAEGPVLWFASDRPGGKGKLDLWYMPLDTVFFCPCNLPILDKKIPKLPKFKQPVNASALNTTGNDGTPFFFAPKQKLYFSSDGLPGLGGYDIYASKKTGDQFSSPENLGPGVNTSYNDLYFFLKPDGLNGYLSSNRPGSFYLDESNKTCCNDLYSVQFAPPLPPSPVVRTDKDSIPLIVQKGEAKVAPQTAPQPVVIAPAKLEDFTGLPLYFDNDEPDKRTNRTTTKRNYDETVQTYLEKQTEYREHFATGLKGAKQEAAETAVDNFFENEVRRGYERLGQLCDLLLVRLQKGEKIEVLIKGFTSPRAESDYNLNLGKRRVSSVRNQFSVYADGALETYIRSGQLKITETSFGETTAKAGISDNLKDLRNSVYHPDAAKERRVEIVEIRSKE
jgi:hypothetical protein